MPCSIQSSAGGIKAALETGKVATRCGGSPLGGEFSESKSGRESSCGSTCVAQAEAKDWWRAQANFILLVESLFEE